MTKTTSGSFIIWCTPFSDCGKKLNRAEPTYNNKHVCIIQVEALHEDKDFHDWIMVFELIYKE